METGVGHSGSASSSAVHMLELQPPSPQIPYCLLAMGSCGAQIPLEGVGVILGFMSPVIDGFKVCVRF